MVFSELLRDINTWAFALIETYGLYSVFLAVIMEELLLPVPAPLVIMGAAFLLVPATLGFWDAMKEIFLLIVIPASIASVVGAFLTYQIGYHGGRPVVERVRTYVRWLDLEKMENALATGKKVWPTIIVLRAIPFFPIVFALNLKHS